MDKLRSDKQIKITLYLDQELKTKYMEQVLNDVQTLAGNDIVETSSKVLSRSH